MNRILNKIIDDHLVAFTRISLSLGLALSFFGAFGNTAFPLIGHSTWFICLVLGVVALLTFVVVGAVQNGRTLHELGEMESWVESAQIDLARGK